MNVTQGNGPRGVVGYLKRQHLAMLALFFALGGTSFAASATLLPSNSVGTRQVINGSLHTNDLSRTARSALKGSRGPRGPAGVQGAAGAPGPAAPRLFVALNANGTISKNSGATLAARAAAGVYRIAFDTDISRCVYVATAGEDASPPVEDYHLYTSRTGTNTVNVHIFDEKNVPLDRPFYLAVVC